MQKINLIIFTIISLSSSLMYTSCGDNIFSKVVKKDDKDKALTALNSGDYDAATDYLEGYLKDNPNDNQAKGMLANVQMKKSGVDVLEIAGKITAAQSSNSGSDWMAITSSMPAGTESNLAALDKAVNTLSSIPPESRSPDQNYQLGIAQASLAVVIAKKNGCDENGKIPPEKVDVMSDTEATKMVVLLNDMTTNLGSSGTNDSGAKKMGGISQEIGETQGTSDSEKLKNYLKAQSGVTPTPVPSTTVIPTALPSTLPSTIPSF